MVSLQAVYIKIVDLIFRRVILLFLVGILLSYLFIDHNKIVLKTLNTLMPSSEDLSDFVNHPAQMDHQKLEDILIYYKYLYMIMGSDTFEKPAACGMVGYAYYYLGDEKRSIDYFLKSVKFFDRSFWTYYDLGVIYYNKEHYQQAMYYFSLAKEAYPYTMTYILSTRAFSQIAATMKLTQNDFQKRLDQQAENLKVLYTLSQLFNENSQLKNEFDRKRINLLLF